jgi:hypothetical protein
MAQIAAPDPLRQDRKKLSLIFALAEYVEADFEGGGSPQLMLPVRSTSLPNPSNAQLRSIHLIQAIYLPTNRLLDA